MPLFQLCQNAGRRKPTQLKLSRNRHMRDYSREVGQHPVTARHANLRPKPNGLLIRDYVRDGDLSTVTAATVLGV